MARRRKNLGGVSWPPAEGVVAVERSEQDEAKEALQLNPAERVAEQYRICFSTEAGQFVLKDLQLQFEDRRSYVPDSNATAFHEGQRDIPRMIRILIAKDAARSDAPQTEGDENG
jgi:hypothetical protein